MAISGTMTAGDMVSYNDADVGIDVGDSGTFVQVETWTTDVRVTPGERSSTSQYSHGGVGEVAVGGRVADQIEIDFFYTESSTDPYYNLASVFQGSGSQLCDVQWSQNGATTGDLLHTTAAAKIKSVGYPNANAGDAAITKFTLVLEGFITTTVIS